MTKIKKTTARQKGNSTGEACLICLNPRGKIICRPYNISRNVFDCCCKYLHTGIANEHLKSNWSYSTNDEIALCENCFDSALQLTEINEQLEMFNKEMSNLILSFSLSILHRRAKINAKNSKESNEQSESTPLEIDITGISMSGVQETESTEDELFVDYVKMEAPGDEYVDLLEHCILPNTSEDSDDSNNISTKSKPSIKPKSFRGCNKSLGVKVKKLNCKYGDDGKIILSDDNESAGTGTMDDRQKKSGANIDNNNDAEGPLSENGESSLDSEILTSASGKIKPQNIDVITIADDVETDKKKNRKNKILRHTCTVCSKSFITRFKLIEHNRVHTGEKPNKCSKCPKSFAAYANLTRHFQLVHSEVKRFKCEKCEYATSRKDHLKLHQRKHIPKVRQTKKLNYKCSFCDQTSVSVRSARCHYKKSHKHTQKDMNFSLQSCVTPIKIEKSA